MGTDGTLRLRGRIGRTPEIAEETASPVILDGKHAYTKLVLIFILWLYIQHVHERLHHGGTEAVVNELQRAWIVVLQSLSHLSTQSIPSTDIDIDIIDCMTDVKQIKKENTETSPNSFEEHKVTNNYDNKSKVTNNYEDKNKVTKKYEDKPKVTNNYDDMHSCEDEPNSNNINEDETNKDLLRKKKHKKSKNKKVDRIKKYYSVTIIDSEELKAVNDKRKSELENVLKCDSCVLGTHAEPPPRAECPTCHKHVRASLLRAHERTHAPRAHYACEPCARAFVCRATYEAHLKHARAHAGSDVLSTHAPRAHYACEPCARAFVCRANYEAHLKHARAHAGSDVLSTHAPRAHYACEPCARAFGLATPRCVTRHVRRAHDGVHERARDQMCHHCGLAFRVRTTPGGTCTRARRRARARARPDDKKSLTEHVARHTGARPLTCTRCGRAFRQRAALYAHARRLHADT
ncbi:Uncharacterized protein OBRU01_11875 [Operophtera brumata]|uniref:C2H2-type domain-containing protein n=1 Tax=Operophtera brumata TaxID=104452 RepID=A0A0L7LBB6_OPEBR|nr:Uncharacterized protein OBRU01_11875 [Operophtera brumata]